MTVRDDGPKLFAHADGDGCVDYEIIDELLALGNTWLLGDLISTYRLEVTSLFRELERALDANDIAAVAKTSHSLSGCSASIGATSLSAAAASIEQLAKTGSLEGYEPLMNEVLARWRCTLRVLGAELLPRFVPGRRQASHAQRN